MLTRFGHFGFCYASSLSSATRVAALTIALVTVSSSAWAGDWNQWRGPNRNGVAAGSPPLIDVLPADGLRPEWISEPFPSAGDGGWSCPVIAGGKVFLFLHTREKQASEAKRQYPWIPPENRTDWSAERFAEYERHRRDEDERIGKASYTYQEGIACVDLATGKTLWRTSRPTVYTRFLQSGSPTVIGGCIWVPIAGRRVGCYSADDGREIWNVGLPGDFRDEYLMASIAVVDGVAIARAGPLVGLDAQTGNKLWEGAQNTHGSHSSPVVWNSPDGPKVIVNVVGRDTVCLEPRTGEERWRVRSESYLSTPVVVGNRLITLGSSRKKGLRCFEIGLSGAEHQWTYNGLADDGASPVVVGDRVFAQGARRLVCVDVETGEARWTTTLRLRDPRFTSLVAADRKIFYTCEGILGFAARDDAYTPLFVAKIDDKGLLASEAWHRERLGTDALEKEPDGEKKAQRLYRKKLESNGPLHCVSPAFADGRLVVRLNKGLACYDLRRAAVSR